VARCHHHKNDEERDLISFMARPTGPGLPFPAFAKILNLSGQIEALKAAGATTIYREKTSGARADRPQLTKMMAALKRDDIVVVSKLDQLGRSTLELLKLVDAIGKAGAAFVCAAIGVSDVTSATVCSAARANLLAP
jgi:DNA invertase Pin-like site-specific DNA recombinase